jgi:short-subunit dehydrogenase
MNRLQSWLSEQFQRRPWWMNLLMVFCFFMAVVYVPWDFFMKPVSADQEAWLGILLRGWAAKATEPIHWAIYAAGAYGFWRMRDWMWPWAAVYAASVAFGMFWWPIVYLGGFGSVVLGLISLTAFGALAWALWRAQEQFAAKPPALSERYGEWAVVTGASAGIGREFARALARDGMSCVLTARREDRLRELADELEKSWNVDTKVVAADLADPSGVDRIAAAVEGLDVALLVNNAGFGYVGRFEKQDPQRLRAMIEVNCTAPVLLTAKLLPALVKRGRGAVVVVGSTAGRQPLPFLGVYAASKGFDLLFGEALWVELRDRGIDVLVLQPGPVATEFEEVSGENRVNPTAAERPEQTVRIALEALGRQPSVVSGPWINWARANANRLLPRSVLALVASDFTEQQTPPEML